LSTPFLFRNSQGQWELLVGSQDGAIFHFGNIDGNLLGSFTVLSDSFGSIAEGTNTSPWGADLNSDGKPEWVIGNGRGGIAIYSAPDSLNTGFITSLGKTAIRLFPNPGALPTLAFSQPQVHPPLLRIFDRFGCEVPHTLRQVDPATWQLDASQAASGLYFVRIDTGEKLPSVIKWLKP
jgi:hypothetical protein